MYPLKSNRGMFFGHEKIEEKFDLIYIISSSDFQTFSTILVFFVLLHANFINKVMLSAYPFAGTTSYLNPSKIL